MAKKIYTKTGDAGFTSLLGGTKVPKNDWRIEAYGTVDELNSFIGLLYDKLNTEVVSFSDQLVQLEKIQNNLFKVGSVLSYDMTGSLKLELPNVGESDVTDLENWMDEMISLSHVCRTISRRAERCTIQAIQYPIIIKYINRLSDYFFMLSRYIAYEFGISERIWKG